MKLTIHMAMGSNEQAVAELDLKDLEQWDQRVEPIYRRLEARVGDRARRMIEGNKQMRDLFAKDPQTANLAHNLILLIMGQVPEPNALGLVEGLENKIPAEMELRTEEQA